MGFATHCSPGEWVGQYVSAICLSFCSFTSHFWFLLKRQYISEFMLKLFGLSLAVEEGTVVGHMMSGLSASETGYIHCDRCRKTVLLIA